MKRFSAAGLADKWHALGLFLEHGGPSARVLIGLYMFVAGSMRIITGNTTTQINIFSARMYGGLLVLGAVCLLFTTQSRYRCGWPGRIAAMFCAALWLLIIANAWGAWVSISGAFVFVLALGNEVRIHEC